MVGVFTVHAETFCTIFIYYNCYPGKNYYLVDGGPTTYPEGTRQIRSFNNVLETFLRYTTKGDGSNSFKCDGMMVTHPDGDHVQGVIRLLEKFPPNKTPVPGDAKFDFKGPMLLTTRFRVTRELIDALTAADFVEKDLATGAKIDGFENEFTFYYPNADYKGLLCSYSGKRPTPIVMFRSAERTSFTVDTSTPNLSSILLVIDDPKDKPKKNPLVSLNGDAIGYSVLEVLKDKSPCVFKVPHHGSLRNNTPLKRYRPSNQKQACEMISAFALLELAHSDPKHANLMAYKQSKYFVVSFNQSFRESDKELRVGGVKPQLDANIMLESLAKSFEGRLAVTMNTKNVMNGLKKEVDQIEENIKDPAVDSTEVYAQGIADFTLKSPDRLCESVYAATKTHVINEQKESGNQRMAVAYIKLFEFLEKDYYFEERIAVLLAKEFYSQIKAQTYFASAGNLHGHPNWEVIHGIIDAAKDRHDKD